MPSAPVKTARRPAAATLDRATVMRLRLVLVRIGRLLRQRADAGVTPSQLSAMVSIDKAGTLSLGALAEAENIAPSTLSRSVSALADRGLVDRHPDATDRRVTVVELTPEGATLLEAARGRSAAYLAQRVGALSPDEQAVLAEALPILEQLLEEDR